jgi:Mo-dependent nitrogenase C-terminus
LRDSDIKTPTQLTYQPEKILTTMLKTNNLPIILPAFIQPENLLSSPKAANKNKHIQPKIDFLKPLRQWLDELEIQNRKLAYFIAKSIPAQCPFERDIVVFGRTIAHIPPMCKLNPLYDQLVGLRFRALCYLVDQCGEDIQSYC